MCHTSQNTENQLRTNRHSQKHPLLWSHVMLLGMSLGLFVFTLSGCQQTFTWGSFAESITKTGFTGKNDEGKKFLDNKFDVEAKNEIEPDFIGDHTVFSGLNVVLIEGVGLVTGLDNSGEDPPVSNYRAELLNSMRKIGVPEPNEVLKSPATALVIVRGYLPPLIQEGDEFDLEVRVPEGSAVKSLNGGWLMECMLSEQAIVPGKGLLKGDIMAKAEGPILVSTGEGTNSTSRAKMTRGHIVGGAISRTSRNMQINLHSDFRSFRNAKRIESVIGKQILFVQQIRQ